MVEPDGEAVFAIVAAPPRIEAFTADISAIYVDDMVVLPAADQVPSGRNGLDLEPNRALEAGGVDHEATPCRVSAA